MKDDTDWTVPLSPLEIVSLMPCYIKFNVKGKTTSRALKLLKLDLYLGDSTDGYTIYELSKTDTHSKIVEEWDQTSRELHVTVKIVNFG